MNALPEKQSAFLKILRKSLVFILILWYNEYRRKAVFSGGISDTILIPFFRGLHRRSGKRRSNPPKNRAKRPKFTPYNANLSEWE